MNTKPFPAFAAVFFLTLFCAAPAAAFSDGWVMTLNANVGGSYTLPSISRSDLDTLCATGMNGMVGFVAGGDLEVGYIWDTADAFGLREDNPFSGIGLFFNLGISQGYAGQICSAQHEGSPIDVYVNVYYTPVISVGATGKAYFFDNRMAAGLSLGAKIICDAAPQYEIYSSDTTVVEPEVGTIIVDDQMMTSINPVMFYVKPSVEYTVPLSRTMELNLGGYLAFNLYRPKYITMPDKVMDLLESENPFFDAKEDPLNSYFINSFDFGIILGLNFRLGDSPR